MLARRAAAAPGGALFNGRNLDGWQRAAHGLWTVEAGEIVGRCDHERPGPGYLLTEEEFSDFRLDLEFWISAGGNSGVYIREPRRTWGPRGDDRPAHGANPGYEVQIDYRDPKNSTGALYNVRNAARVAGAEERWNRMRVECLGMRIRVWVAGELVNDYSPSRSRSGVVGMQIHGGRPHLHIVKFRNITLENRA
jgi:hypothetical protein